MPSQLISPAVVVRVQNYGEADLIVALLTADRGRLDVLARSARSSRKRFAGVLRPFCQLQVLVDLKRHGSLATLTGAELERDLLGTDVEYGALCLASYLCELAAHVSQPEHADPQLLRWLTACVPWCAGRTVAEDLPPLKLASEAALLRVLGLLPDLLICGRCSGDVQPVGHWDPDGHGLLCPHCSPTQREATPYLVLAQLQASVMALDRASALLIPATGRSLVEDRMQRLLRQAVPQAGRAERALRSHMLGLD
jgi:DNA repair protein RecO (recombination protein O)